MTSAEVDMNRHDIGEVEFNEDDPFFATENRRFVKREADQPRRSPMRRKDRWRQEEGMKRSSIKSSTTGKENKP